VDNEAEGYTPARQQEIETMLGKRTPSEQESTEAASLTEEQEV